MKTIKTLPKKTELQEIFEYRDGNLYWKKTYAKAKKGAIVGWVEKNGYKAASLNGVRYRLHRLVFEFHYENCPDILDHINGDRSDNRIENLRPATISQNNVNRKHNRNNKIGLKGVCADQGRFKASIKINNRSKHLGYFQTPEEAHSVYMMAAKAIYGEFAWTKNSAST
jgi:hypothetical protein